MVKKLIKRARAAVNKVSVVIEEDKYNEFGTCIACQDGRTECLHNNQAQDGRNTVCVTCGKVL